MRDLNDGIAERVSRLVEDKYHRNPRLKALVNAVIDDESDFEHLITFLDESVSRLHRKFAGDMREIFESVLRDRLRLIAGDHGGEPPTELFEALLDMHRVEGCDEELKGMLTLNYDHFVETAALKVLGQAVNLGVTLNGEARREGPTLIKLHGSFDWRDEWPISLEVDAVPQWIPPGIQKTKDRYPFNLLWGRAREVLDCDVLRIIGCRLGPNDWDLVSLLFTTRHTNSSGKRYRIEVIDSPGLAENLKRSFPYLDVSSILEIEPVGPIIISEFIGGAARELSELAPEERTRLFEHARQGENWFRLWLKHRAEFMYRELGSVRTHAGAFERLLES